MKADIHYTSDNQFTHYSNNSVTIKDKTYNSNIIVTNQSVLPFIDKEIDQLEFSDLEDILDLAPDLIILGSGNKITYPKLDVLEKISQNGIGFEVMQISSLCRTFNFLISENRKVACILFF